MQKVLISQPGIISQAAGNLLSGGTTIAITFVLSLFLLASGTMFYEKIVQSFGRMSEKKRALRVVYDVEREISRYLLTVTIINGGLGVAIGLGLWAIGMPNPFVWGVAAALLNFLPYIGAAVTLLMVAAVAVISFDHLLCAGGAGLGAVLQLHRGPGHHAAGRGPPPGDQCGRHLHRGRLLVMALGFRRRADRRAYPGGHPGVLRPFRKPASCWQFPGGAACGRRAGDGTDPGGEGR